MHDYRFGYCTNVHAGVTLEEAKTNLAKIATRVRSNLNLSGRLPVGLWLAEQATEDIQCGDSLARFRDWLRDSGLKPYTFNGFPQGDFHSPVVKYSVYEPPWNERARVDYTCALGNILAALLDDGQSGSISTLPLGWPHDEWTRSQFQACGAHLRFVAQHFHELLERTGHEIVLAIEPEPGCVLDTADDMIDFLNEYVFRDDSATRRHITVCHDICHSAVMFESQIDVLSKYKANGIRIGKVQVSSAMHVPWTSCSTSEHAAILSQLAAISEPRYLHQTTRLDDTRQLMMSDDLPQALAAWSAQTTHDWRIHFHVPIYTKHFGHLQATREDIAIAVHFLESQNDSCVDGNRWFTGDYEVETYAWGVLPEELKVNDLSEGITRELKYLESLLDTITS